MEPLQHAIRSLIPARSAHAPRQDNITGRTYLLRGRPVLVLARWAGAGPRNVLVQDQDGARQVRPFRGLRRLPGGCHAG